MASTMIPADEQSNYEAFREYLSEPLIRQLAVKPKKQSKRVAKGRKNAIKPVEKPDDDIGEQGADELADFVEYLAMEIFVSLPSDLRTLSYSAIQNNPSLKLKYDDPLPTETLDSIIVTLPPSILDSMTSYNLLSDAADLPTFLSPTLSSYVASTTAPPPIWANTRSQAEGCEICERPWIPLTYHHLIPRSTHARVLKRGWHEEWDLNKVAWLCRACHSFVHGCASNEELAKELYSVERLLEREDVQKWAKWAGRVRWKKT